MPLSSDKAEFWPYTTYILQIPPLCQNIRDTTVRQNILTKATELLGHASLCVTLFVRTGLVYISLLSDRIISMDRGRASYRRVVLTQQRLDTCTCITADSFFVV